MPGLIVNTREFLPLARALAGDRPVYGFVSHVYTTRRWRGFAVDDLAEEYAEFIAANAPGGRCALLGWSIGGDLAVEVARRLEGRVKVAFVAAVDVFEPERMLPRQPMTCVEVEHGLASWLSRSSMADPWRALLARMTDSERCWVAEQLGDPAQTVPNDGNGDEAAEFILWATLDSRVRLARHRHAACAQPLHVYVADSSLQHDATLRDWSEFTPVVATEVIAGADHLDIVRHPALGASLRHRLRDIDSA
ncbi:thioesterase domain-containing protein [Diaphorobacter aerolatus]